MKVLVTGAAGFIGSHLAKRLLERGDTVIGLDNLNDYYPVSLKLARLASMEGDGFSFIKADLTDMETLSTLFEAMEFDAVVHLAAQAGVRYSIENPRSYIESNIVGFANILECCRHNPVRHLVYASSSSVYGGNDKVPFSEDDRVDCPMSLYAATKKADELMAFCYSSLYSIPATGLRYFTVYGPWGRPDMAPFLFADAIVHGRPIKVFNGGDMLRDFTYIDDIVEGTVRVLDSAPDESQCERNVPHRVFNIGCSNPVQLMDFIAEMEKAAGREAEKVMLPMQPGDVKRTFADTTKLEQAVGYRPKVSVGEGVARFMAWYNSDENPLR